LRGKPVAKPNLHKAAVIGQRENFQLWRNLALFDANFVDILGLAKCNQPAAHERNSEPWAWKNGLGKTGLDALSAPSFA
jgi:hypothetical protein